jgi:nucleoside-triphosphatase
MKVRIGDVFMMYLLTAKPRTGKSTAIKRLIDKLGNNKCIGFFTDEIKENGIRVGFQINTLSGKQGNLAMVGFDSEIRIGRYGVNITSFEELCLPELNKIVTEGLDFDYVIIDEIGPIQMHSESFKEMLIQLLNSGKTIIGTIFYESYPWIDEFKLKDGVNLIELTYENRENIIDELLELIL